MTPWLSRLFEIRRSEIYGVSVMALLLFFLVAANNLLKIIRDSVFLSHHSVSELPYLYILVAVIAGALMVTYRRHISTFPIARLILTTNGIILISAIFFWLLLTFFNPGWSHYAFYIWSAIVGAIAVAQAWTLTGEIFSASEGKRLYGLVAAGGTVGGATAGFGTKWMLDLSVDVNHLLWSVVILLLAASILVLCARRRRLNGKIHSRGVQLAASNDIWGSTLGTLPGGSRYLKAIAMLVFVSAVVSTLIDFNLKVGAKEIYPSQQSLAGFFSSYYAWVSIATFFSQTILTGPILSALGLVPSLYVTPSVLLAGSAGIVASPGLLMAALTKIADASLRNSIHRSSMEIVFMALPDDVRNLARAFLNVVVERLGDATAGFIILFYSLVSTGPKSTYAPVISVGLIGVWMLIISLLRLGHMQTLGNGLKTKEFGSGEDWSAHSRSAGGPPGKRS